MSVRHMKAAWLVGELTPSQKLVMLCLAWHANDSDSAYPSVATMALETGLSKRQTQRAIAELRKKELIVPRGESVGGRGRTSIYAVLPGRTIRSERPAASDWRQRDPGFSGKRDYTPPPLSVMHRIAATQVCENGTQKTASLPVPNDVANSTANSATMSPLPAPPTVTSAPAIPDTMDAETMSPTPPKSDNPFALHIIRLKDKKEMERSTHSPGEHAAFAAQWESVKQDLKGKIKPFSYDTWITPLRVVGVDGDTAVLSAPSPEFFEVTQKYGAQMLESFAACGVDVKQIKLIAA